MNDQSSGNGTGRRGRRGKRFLSPCEKYEIWLQLVRGEDTIAEAAERPAGGPVHDHAAAQVRAEGALDGVGGVEAGGAGRQRPDYGAGGGEGRDRPAVGGAARRWASS